MSDHIPADDLRAAHRVRIQRCHLPSPPLRPNTLSFHGAVAHRVGCRRPRRRSRQGEALARINRKETGPDRANLGVQRPRVTQVLTRQSRSPALTSTTRSTGSESSTRPRRRIDACPFKRRCRCRVRNDRHFMRRHTLDHGGDYRLAGKNHRIGGRFLIHSVVCRAVPRDRLTRLKLRAELLLEITQGRVSIPVSLRGMSDAVCHMVFL